MQLTNLNLQIEAFHAALVRGRESLEDAGRILVALIDAEPSAKELIMETHPDVTADTLELFERIGRRQLVAELCYTDSPGARALRRCPYSEQQRFTQEGVPMLVLSTAGTPDDLLVPLNAMNREQAKQVFGSKRVRSLAEQRAWLQANKPAPKPKTIQTAKPYTVAHGKVTFHEPVTLTTADLARLLADMA